MPGRLEFEFTTSTHRAGARPKSPDAPMRILLCGDFSGRGPRAINDAATLGSRRTHRVDIDNLDEVMSRLQPSLQLPLDDSVHLVSFDGLDDFHPDSLFERLDLFTRLRGLRSRLSDPARFETARAELLGANAGADESTMDRLMGRAPSAPQPAANPSGTGIDALIQRIVAPHIVADHGAEQAPLVRAVDMSIAESMRTVLHAPPFQAVESAWRGVQWLINSLELDENLQLHLFDVTREELLADIVAAQGQLAQTGLHRALADRWRNVPDGESWSALVGLLRFGPGDTDIGLLAALGLIASQAGGPLLAEADPVLAGDDGAALAGWRELRRSEAAPWIGLAAPRVLLRLPYGKRTDAVTSFDFEEFVGAPEHEAFLWGNPGLAAALLLGRAFGARGWAFEPGDERELGDLPAYTFEQDGEKTMQACAETFIGEQRAQGLLAAGLMPLLSHRNRNAVTVMRFQSVAEPPTALAGAWRSD